MKRIIFTAVILIAAGTLVYAQQAKAPASSSQNKTSVAEQTRQEAREYLDQAKTNTTEFESTYDDLLDRNGGSDFAAAYRRLKAEIDSLESRIKYEESSIDGSLTKGARISTTVFDHLRQLLDQYKAKTDELEKYIQDDGSTKK